MKEIFTKQRPEKWDMLLKYGDVWPPYAFELVDQDGIELLDFSITMKIKRSKFSMTASKVLTEDSGFIVDGSLVKFQTFVDIMPGEYYHDITVTLDNGEVHTQYAGKITVI